MKNFDSIEEALNVDTEVVENDKIEPRKNQLKKSEQNDSEKEKKAITLKINSIVEKMILRNPGQWIWTHNRWK